MVKKRMTKKFIYVIVFLCLFNQFNIITTHAEPTDNGGLSNEDYEGIDELLRQQFIEEYNNAKKKFDEEIKPLAIGVWDSNWFKAWLIEAMKREYGPVWYEGYDPQQLKQLIDQGIQYAKDLIEESTMVPTFYDKKGNPRPGVMATFSFNVTGGECGLTDENPPKQVPECIQVSFAAVERFGEYIFYRTPAIKSLVHESVHAFLYKTGWSSYYLGMPYEYDPLAEKYVWYEPDHCLTWLTKLGPSNVSIAPCNGTYYDIEELTTLFVAETIQTENVIEECLKTDDSNNCFPKIPYLPVDFFLPDYENCLKLDADRDGLSNDFESNSIPPTNPWTEDSDFDGLETGECEDAKDVFPTDPSECFDYDKDGIGNMHDAAPMINDLDKDGIGEMNDGQPFNRYCIKDNDRDGLCGHSTQCDPNIADPSCKVLIDPNDESLDSDSDGTPDYADQAPDDAANDYLKPGIHSLDVDGDGLCDGEGDIKEANGIIICKGGPDPCPLKWDCDGDWLSDGFKIPLYITATISMKCPIDKDGDGLCHDVDPNDDAFDTDGDGVPDYADKALLDPLNKDLKEGFYLEDIDDDGVCNGTKDLVVKDVIKGEVVVCSAGPDLCQLNWDCNADSVSDGGKTPQYIKTKNLPIYNLMAGPDPYSLIATDILNFTLDDPDEDFIGRTMEKKMGIVNIGEKQIWQDLTNDGKEYLYNAKYNPFLAIEVPESCNMYNIKDSLLDQDNDGLINCIDSDIDNDGIANAIDQNPYVNVPETCAGPEPDVEPKEICADKLDNNYDGKVDEGCLNCNSPGAGTASYVKGDCDTVTMLVNADLLKKQCKSLIKGPPAEVVGCWEGCKAQYPCEDNNCELYDQQYGQQYYCGLDCTASWKEGCKNPCWNIIGDKDELQKCVYKCEEWNWEYLECAKAYQPLSYEEAAATLPMCHVDEADVTYVDEATGKSFVDHVCGVVCNKSIKGSENCDFDNDGLLNDEDDDPYHAFDSEGGVNPDYDNDGIANLMDNCMDVANTEQFDSDFDGNGDACEEAPQEGGSLPLFAEGEDSDGDGTPDGYDDAPNDPLMTHDMDGDGIDNENEENDIDGDGVYDWDEAATCAYCKYDPNETKDDDGDGIGNNLESKLFSLSTGKSLSQETNDNDGDGMPDGFDTDQDGLSDGNEIVAQYDKKTGKVIYYQLFDPTMVDTDYNGLLDPIEYNNGCDMGLFEEAYYGDVDLDGQANCYDSDADGDGIANKLELAGGPFANDASLKELFKTDPKLSDTDGDGIKDAMDNCPTISNTDQKDTDKVLLYGLYALGNACDPDDDDDGALDDADCAPTIKWVAPTMPEYCNNKVDDNCNGQFDENCSGDSDGDDIIDSGDACPYIPSQKGESQLCAEYSHFIPLYHTNIDDINNDGCMCAFCMDSDDCNPGFKCIGGNKCQVGPDYVNYKGLYHECCLICNFDNDCEGLKIWKAQYPEPVPEPQPEQPLAEPEQPPQPDQGAGGDSAGDDKPMLPAGKGPVLPSDRVAKPEPSIRPVGVQPAKEKPIEEKPTDRLPAQLPPAPPIVDWDGDGIIPKDNCPCVPDQDPDSVLVKSCESMDYCENMTDYIEAKIACNGEDCSEKSCAPGMRCWGGKCVPWPNFGWPIVKDLYHSCCGEDTDEVCNDGKIWIAQYSDPNDVDGDGLANECEDASVDVYKTDSYKYDSDGDGIKDGEDNCPNISNPDQKNTAFELCMTGKIHPIPSKFEIIQETNGEKTVVLVDEATYCSVLSAKVEDLCNKQILIVEGNKMCEDGKVLLAAWCKQIERLGDACDTDDDGDGVPDDVDPNDTDGIQ